MNKVKKVLTILFIFVFIFINSGCSMKNNKKNGLKIVTTTFPGYDFSRAVIGNSDNITMLIKPGGETHTFDPTPKDIIEIEQADVFIYTGGESDTWVDNILKTTSNKDLVVIRLMDIVEVLEEEQVEGMEEEEEENHTEEEKEYDEHVWTSPVNASKIVEKIKNELVKLDKNSAEAYKKNAKDYEDKLKVIDKEIRNVVENSKRKELIFGDRFPFRYFVEEYNLTYSAAFPGCSSETEASAKTISYLINKVKETKTPVVLYNELSTGSIAKTLADETDTKTLVFSAAHNVTKEDFENGKTYIDFMNQNIEVLKEALN